MQLVEYNNKNKGLKIALIIAACLAVAGFATAGMLYYKYTSEAKSSATQAAKPDANAQILKDLKAVMTLPDEQPVFATIQDPAKLSGQEFFKDAKVGDKLLIFAQAKKAVIFRPTDKKVINSGPVSDSNVAPAATKEPTKK